LSTLCWLRIRTPINKLHTGHWRTPVHGELNQPATPFYHPQTKDARTRVRALGGPVKFLVCRRCASGWCWRPLLPRLGMPRRHHRHAPRSPLLSRLGRLRLLASASLFQALQWRV
jgi:hypothetical protein